jgi:NAD(P)-dependent dehydrogenase (short-subunit alcohol dehydrogenase family)
MGSLFDITGKTAIVTGSSRGLGRTIAEGLADSGAKLMICSRNIEEGNTTAESIRKMGSDAIAMKVDTSIHTECEALIKETIRVYGHLDIMVCNAGIIHITPAIDVDEEEWNKTMDTNLKGYYNCAQLAAKQMIKQKAGGSIVMISSNASTCGFPGLLSYSVSKGGVDQMVRSMAIEWGQFGIRINAINPGYTDNIMTGLKSDSASDEDFLRKHTPLKPRCESKELIGPVIFLASGASSNITGATLLVDGGYTIR